MKIMVFDVPAESGGALTILKQYYEKAIIDNNNKWIFVLSTPKFDGFENVKIINYPWVKKSWFHRLYFDMCIAKRIVNKNKVDEVLSLQNVIIRNVNIRQTLYLHQPLPFVDKQYGITENFKFWVYQNIIGKIIFRSIQNADKVIVQTKWMKEACLKKVKTDSNKFEIKPPDIKINVNVCYKQENNNVKLFFYPASALEYKNHSIIVEAVKDLCNRGINNFNVVFTLVGSENKHIKILKQIIKENELPIKFVGQLNIEKVYEYYSRSVLIFPSYVETFGLPMLEARMHDSPILASNCAFSHEILDGYNKVEFFDPFDYNKLSELMISLLL